MCASKRAQLSDAVLPDLCISGNFICPCTDDQGSSSFPDVLQTSSYVSKGGNLNDIVINSQL